MKGKIKNEENVVLCGLCGRPIEAPKGTRKGELSREQAQGAHNNCLKKQHDITAKHGMHPNTEVMALLRGLIELHPEVEQTNALFDYRVIVDDMKEELFESFPYLKKREEEMDKLRKDAEEKVEEAKE